jgi:hypothetical protein
LYAPSRREPFFELGNPLLQFIQFGSFNSLIQDPERRSDLD